MSITLLCQTTTSKPAVEAAEVAVEVAATGVASAATGGIAPLAIGTLKVLGEFLQQGWDLIYASKRYQMKDSSSHI